MNTDGLSATGGYTGMGEGTGQVGGAGNCPAKLSKKKKRERAVHKLQAAEGNGSRLAAIGQHWTTVGNSGQQ